MAAESGRDLRRLAKEHRISFKPPVSSKDDWPSRYRNHFDNVTKTGANTYEHFVASIDPLTDQHPWRENTKFRAEWLAKKTGQLVQQQRNEAGWRFGIENTVFRRFAFEVACYEVGTNPLFDDRAQEVVLHNPLLQNDLPNQEPDRIYGLRETRTFRDLLSRLNVRSSDLQGKSIGESVQSSPFRDASDPLLFPFLILEAKSEKSSNGFDAISVQTAFPILGLLRLQEDLARQVDDGKLDDGPLVWFFANRGDAWRVYGCYVTEETPAGYSILQLWEGSILSNDKALQLILIVDYVFDWARDVYRPSILRQLKSLTRIDPYDEISAVHDSDIHSMRREITSWIPPPKNTTDLTRENSDPLQDMSQPEPFSDYERRLLALSGGNMSRTSQSLRSPTAISTRMVGLHLTEANTTSMLQWADANDYNNQTTLAACRILVNFVSQWDEIMLLSNGDLLDIESWWTGSSSPVTESSKGQSASLDTADTYALFEYAMYIDEYWRIVREITYLAISKTAFEILIEHAAFKKKHDGISSIPGSLRPCSVDVLRKAICCLKSGSVHQTFLAAVSCSCYALFLLQETVSLGQESPTPTIGLEKLPHSRLRGIIAKYHAYCLPQISKARGSGSSNAKRQKIETSHHELGNDPCQQPERSFVRISERKDDISASQGHDHHVCNRCNHSGIEVFPYPKVDKNPFTESGMALVTALAFKRLVDRDGTHELCLFAQDLSKEIDALEPRGVCGDKKALSKVLKVVSQTDRIYHTIKHPLPNSFARSNSHYEVRWDSVVWNLPLTMYALDTDQREALDDWVEGLGKISIRMRKKDMRDTWNSLQMSLFLLRAGHAWEEVTKTVENHREDVQKSMDRDAKVPGLKNANGIIEMRERLYVLYADKAREEHEKREAGEIPVIEPSYSIPSAQRGIGKKLLWRDGNVSKYDSCTLNFLK